MRSTALSILAALLVSCGTEAQPPVVSLPDTAGEIVIVCFGDSLTAGLGLSAEASYPGQLQQKLDALAPGRYRVVNAGVSGDTTSMALERVDWALADSPAIAIVVLGANDGLRGIAPKETEQALTEIVTRFEASGATVLLGGMRLPPNYGLPFDQEFRAIFPSVAAATGATLIPFFLEGVAGDPGRNQPDGIHPTAEGYAHILETVLWPALAPLLGLP